MRKTSARSGSDPAQLIAAAIGLASLFLVAPAHAEIDFAVHEVGQWGNGLGQTCLADLDHDGDLDFISGSRAGVSSASSNTVWWWEYKGPDDWERHEIGSNHGTDVGGICHDVDGDGWVDQISGKAWYRNNHDGTFTRHAFGGIEAHDMRIIEFADGYGLASLNDTETSLKLYRIPNDPTEQWPETDVGDWSDASDTGGQAPHSGLTVCDVDGDGREDLVVYNRWYRNEGGGSSWERHDIPYTHHVSKYFGTLSDCADLDGDGDADIAMSDHDGSWGVWAENEDGDGTSWTVHVLTKDRNKMHSMQIADFDGDGDRDIYMGDTGNPGESGTFAIFENDGSGNFTERLFPLDVPGHETRAGDVDGDGDIDLVSKPWDYSDTDNAGRHVFLRNTCVEDGTCDPSTGSPDTGPSGDAGTDGGMDPGDVDSGTRPEPDTGSTSDGGTASDGTSEPADGGTTERSDDSDGASGGCGVAPGSAPAPPGMPWMLLIVAGLWLRRRR